MCQKDGYVEITQKKSATGYINKEKAFIIAKIPPSRSVQLSFVKASVNIGEIDGDCQFSVRDKQVIFCKKAKNIDVKAEDQGFIIIDYVDGKAAKLSANGVSFIEIKDGKVITLEASAKKKGCILFKGLALAANLSADDGSSIDAREVVGRPCCVRYDRKATIMVNGKYIE